MPLVCPGLTPQLLTWFAASWALTVQMSRLGSGTLGGLGPPPHFPCKDVPLPQAPHPPPKRSLGPRGALGASVGLQAWDSCVSEKRAALGTPLTQRTTSQNKSQVLVNGRKVSLPGSAMLLSGQVASSGLCSARGLCLLAGWRLSNPSLLPSSSEGASLTLPWAPPGAPTPLPGGPGPSADQALLRLYLPISRCISRAAP